MSKPDMENAAAEPATGYFEEVAWRDGSLSVAGWILAPGRPIDRILLNLNGSPADAAPPKPRPDVQAAHPWIATARHSGFHLRADCDSPEGRIDLVGEWKSRAVCRMGAHFNCDPAAEKLIAPPRMTERSTGACGRLHRLQGLRIFTDFYDQIVRFLGSEGPLKLLDWGCGSGRLSAHFIRILKAEVTGADIDAEAVEWCRRHLPGAKFDLIGSEPPLPYRDRSFDAIVACSVFTHLRGRDQERWIGELFRVMRPGGVLLASVHGEFAHRRALHDAGGWGRLRRLPGWAMWKLRGVTDGGEDPAFDGIAPPGYYRNVFQTRESTLRRWTGRFQPLDYIERGVDGFQDLVVLRAGGDGLRQSRGERPPAEAR